MLIRPLKSKMDFKDSKKHTRIPSAKKHESLRVREKLIHVKITIVILQFLILWFLCVIGFNYLIISFARPKQYYMNTPYDITQREMLAEGSTEKRADQSTRSTTQFQSSKGNNSARSLFKSDYLHFHLITLIQAEDCNVSKL